MNFALEHGGQSLVTPTVLVKSVCKMVSVFILSQYVYLPVNILIYIDSLICMLVVSGLSGGPRGI